VLCTRNKGIEAPVFLLSRDWVVSNGWPDARSASRAAYAFPPHLGACEHCLMRVIVPASS
jgi:hypothetical protein